MPQISSDNALRYLCFHRVRFDEVKDLSDCQFDAPGNAEFFIFGPFGVTDETGLRASRGDVWGGFSGYRNLADCQEVFDNPQQHLSFHTLATESWNAILLPVRHHGENSWIDRDGNPLRIQASEDDPGGPPVVITSAGFNLNANPDFKRIVEFVANTDRVSASFDALESNLLNATFVGQNLEIDGITFSVWQDDAAMMDAAYTPGIHRTQIDNFKTEYASDRSSFTRARILRSDGSWDGHDPVRDARLPALG